MCLNSLFFFIFLLSVEVTGPSGGRWFFQLVEEVGRKLVFPLLEFLFGDANWLKDGDVQGVFLTLE